MDKLAPQGGRNAQGHFTKGNTWGAVPTPATRLLRQALIELASPQLMSEKLLQCLDSDKDRMAAITLILAYNLGKPRESIDINTSSSPLPSLSPETLALLVRDMQASDAPVVEADYTTLTNRNPQEKPE